VIGGPASTSWAGFLGEGQETVKKLLRELAEELIQLYATRSVVKGHGFPRGSILKEFEASFEYEETPTRCRPSRTQKDLTEENSMDRLVCGDVGFGKTEVALRAAFRVMMEGKQVAVLVPTTVLAQQHFQTFSRRFTPYPFRVEMLSRFRSRPEQEQILADLAGAKVDLVVGTHRLLQKDVAFKDLGLLVVDENIASGGP
jgi:transcription-repair coupling factor (superfamily II helicase)